MTEHALGWGWNGMLLLANSFLIGSRAVLLCCAVHVSRHSDDRMHKSKVVLGSEAGVPAPTMAQSEDPHFLSSYQMQCMQSRHQDDVGVIKKTRGKKIITPAYAQAGRNMGVVGDPFQDNTMKSALGLEHPMSAVGSLKQATGHLPGYSGHVPRSGDHVAMSRTGDKTLLVENYRSNMKGYTGHRK
mmetsp:Transcript_23020/g.43996  ORF Transcript_23020/g.43996 Transcript_23020/m.43996 type:complete len:186 (+) Transcript_23020:247-804(+)|eukprot:CAMPEP_0114240292 /NCGR_PEP_ID=MMETSP0058-20121206/8985_1 /TAXON_ID=36894 /ORGANISM="Pyramimonas parkeae, CCMP726" /LENGTH=185 /DNA_ID=CAMNT_0001352669 /DNA_START=1073 /DNA_END=1630 /DNA_ORIENTATION=-